MRKGIAILLMAVCLLLSLAASAMGKTGINWTAEKRSRLMVGNPTQLRGCFFTDMWGGTTADQDVRDLLHAYSLVRYDAESGWFLPDRSVVQDVAALDDEQGNRTYLIVLYDNLKWSDGTRITAYDYAFSLLLCMDPVINETGGIPTDCSWIVGAEEYLDGTTRALSGLRVISEDILQIRVKAEALPYYFELSRLMFHPYPVSVIAPGLSVRDDGEGAYLSASLTAEMIRQTVLDEKNGYLAHPSVVSGPYMLDSFDGLTAALTINPYFKGTEEGISPRIGRIEYTLVNNKDMIEKLQDGELDLLRQVSGKKTVRDGIAALLAKEGMLSAANWPCAGLTLIRFLEDSPRIQDLSVRRAIAHCFDKEAFIRRAVGPFGESTDGLYNLNLSSCRSAASADLLPALQGKAIHKDPTAASPTDLAAATPTDLEGNEAAKDAETLTDFRDLPLDELTKYELNIDEAVRLLEEAGWTLNENGEPFDAQRDMIRYKQTEEGGLTGLNLKMALMGTKEEWWAFNIHLVSNLREAGIELTVSPVSEEDLDDLWQGRAQEQYDMLYMAEDLPYIFTPGILTPDKETDSELSSVKEALYRMAQDLVGTEPWDVAGYLRKWLNVQKRITETLPLLPVYTNTYLDFYSRALHDYRPDENITWGEAVVRSYISDIEELSDEEKEAEQEVLNNLEQMFLDG